MELVFARHMQNLLVILFPHIIDALNSAIGSDNRKVRFWVAIATSLIGGILLNLTSLQDLFIAPDPYNTMTYLTFLGLIVGSTQGIYLKYWESHPVRQALFPHLVATATTEVTEKPNVQEPTLPMEITSSSPIAE